MRSRSTAGSNRRSRATLEGVTNVRVLFADALDIDLAGLDPPPGVMVANLPYGVATPVLIRALPAVERFCVMVQREIGERLFAEPGSKAYGAVSVLVQLACERIGGRSVSRHVFVPQPRVDSMLVAFRRRPGFVFGPEWEWTGRVVHGAFAHRRKTLQNSLRLAGPAGPAGRHRGAAGRAAHARAARAARPGAGRVILRAPAKVNLCLRVGPLRSDGYHRLTTLFQAIDLYDELELEEAPETVVEGFPDDTLVTMALAALGETRRVVLRKRIPVAAGLGGGSSDAAAVLRALRGDRDPNELHAIARALGADVPFFLTGAEAGFGTGRGDRIQPLPEFPRGHAFVLVPSDRGLATADVFAACEPNPIFRAVEGDLVRAMHTVRGVRDVAGLMANDLEPVVLSLRPDVAAALAALRSQGALAQIVTGSGPTAFGLFEHRQAAEAAAARIPGAIAASPV